MFVLDKPGVEVDLQGLHRFVEGGTEGLSKELVQNRPVESLQEAIGSRAAHFRPAVLDVVEGQIQLVGMVLSAAELSPVVRQEGGKRDLSLTIERQHVVVERCHGRLGRLGGMQEAESVAAQVSTTACNQTLPTPFKRPT